MGDDVGGGILTWMFVGFATLTPLRYCDDILRFSGDAVSSAARATADVAVHATPPSAAGDAVYTGSKIADDIPIHRARQRGAYTGIGDDGIGPTGQMEDATLIRHAEVSPSTWKKIAQHSDLFSELPNGIPIERSYEFATKLVQPELRIFHTIPANEQEFANIFRRAPSSPELSSPRRARDIVRRVQTNESPGSRRSIINAVERGDDPVIVVIAHNDDGVIKFPDGSQLAISEMSDHCARYEKVCVILSCESDQYLSPSASSSTGVRTEITFSEAAVMSANVSRILGRFKKIRSTRGISPAVTVKQLDGLIKSQMATTETAARVVSRAAKSARLVAGGGGFGAIVYSLDDDR